VLPGDPLPARPTLSPEEKKGEQRDIVMPRNDLPAGITSGTARYERLAGLETVNHHIEKTPDQEPSEGKEKYHMLPVIPCPPPIATDNLKSLKKAAIRNPDQQLLQLVVPV